MKIWKINSSTKPNYEAYGFDCPGCQQTHVVTVTDLDGRHRWTFNGDVDNPTFSPSLLCRGNEPLTDEEHARVLAGEKVEKRPYVCHSFIQNGRIQFLLDCTHNLKGQTIDLPDMIYWV